MSRQCNHKYLKQYGSEIECVTVGGESEEGPGIRPMNFGWVIETQMQCHVYQIPFRFHQTGSILIREDKVYHIPQEEQESQAQKAGMDWAPPVRPNIPA